MWLLNVHPGIRVCLLWRPLRCCVLCVAMMCASMIVCVVLCCDMLFGSIFDLRIENERRGQDGHLTLRSSFMSFHTSAQAAPPPCECKPLNELLQLQPLRITLLQL